MQHRLTYLILLKHLSKTERWGKGAWQTEIIRKETYRMMEAGRQKGEGGNTCGGSQIGVGGVGGGRRGRQMGERQTEVWEADRT